MFLYDKNGNVVNINGGLEINRGTQGVIYRLNDEPSKCIKIYFDKKDKISELCDVGTRFQLDMFDYFKDVFNNKSFCELGDLYYDDKLSKVMAYTMKYYEEKIDDILIMPIDYLLDNFSLLYDAVEILTNDCIRIVDLSVSNIMNTDNGMVVIDYDKYYRDTDGDRDTLNYINKSALMYSFKGIFINCLRKHGIDVNKDEKTRLIIDKLFTINTIPLALKIKMRGISKPIDMFYK